MRDFKYVCKIAIKTSISMVGMFAVILVMFGVFGGESMRRGIGSMVLVYAFIVGSISIFSLYSFYMRMSMTMGGTRKSFFIGVQGAKVIICAVCLATIALGQFVVNNIGGEVIAMNVISMANLGSMGAILFTLMSLSEIAGLGSVKLGKVGMAIFTAGIFGIYGALGGFMMVDLNHSGGGAIGSITTFMAGNWGMMIICAAVTAVLMIISGLAMRKICVKG